MDWHSIQGGVEILPVASCYINRDKFRLYGTLARRILRSIKVQKEHSPKNTWKYGAVSVCDEHQPSPQLPIVSTPILPR